MPWYEGASVRVARDRPDAEIGHEANVRAEPVTRSVQHQPAAIEAALSAAPA